MSKNKNNGSKDGSDRKLQFAFYWCASCGGCDVAVLDINEKILDVAEIADINMWPVAMDFKYEHIKKLEDGYLDVTFINGGVRNSEQMEIVSLLRRKSKAVVAFGSCACGGGIPALANLYSRAEIFERAYHTSPSTTNPERVFPSVETTVPEGKLSLPLFYNSVYKLDDIIPVEYYLPGCPPPPELIGKAVEAIANNQLPPPGSVIAGEKSLCDSCPRKRGEKKIKEFKSIWEAQPDAETCLLEQGIICLGPVTRDGCGARCINVNMPCRGCFGPTPEAVEQGSKMLGAVASVIDSKDEDEIRRIISKIPDPAGTFYRFYMSDSFLRKKITGGTGSNAEEKKEEVAR